MQLAYSSNIWRAAAYAAGHNTCTHNSHPPAPALAARADVAAAAPPSAAGAEASGAGVAKASEVCTHPSRAAEVEDEKKVKSKKVRK